MGFRVEPRRYVFETLGQLAVGRRRQRDDAPAAGRHDRGQARRPAGTRILGLGPQGLRQRHVHHTPCHRPRGCPAAGASTSTWRPAVEATACLSDDRMGAGLPLRLRPRPPALHRRACGAAPAAGRAHRPAAAPSWNSAPAPSASRRWSSHAGVAFQPEPQPVGGPDRDRRGAHAPAEIGVDVELLRPMPDAEALAASCFSAGRGRAAGGPARRRARPRLPGRLDPQGGLHQGQRPRPERRPPRFDVGLAEDAREVVMPVDGGRCGWRWPPSTAARAWLRDGALLSLRYTAMKTTRRVAPLGAQRGLRMTPMMFGPALAAAVRALPRAAARRPAWPS